ncbi:MAG: CRISPR-associated endoribonuclease Cas6 [candidate division KSB1 bacterium]|nr:CRISPR-associated endoribonuclease Cas6 [candidate division KSB1 bacterium]
MRIRLTLQPRDQLCVIPINYQYPLSAAIYKILSQASPEYAAFLHERGYASPAGKPMKLFTFSRLWCPAVRQVENTLRITNRRLCFLQISSPMLEDFVQHFVIGLFQEQQLEIAGPHAVGKFLITQVETLAPPEFEPEMQFRCLSPMVVSLMHEHLGARKIHYLRPGDDQLSTAIAQNLRQKYEIVHHRSAADLALDFEPDPHYIAQRLQQGKRVTKKITIKEGAEEATDIISFEVPFSLKGNPELMEMAYECGIGEKNSMGFGMIERVI